MYPEISNVTFYSIQSTVPVKMFSCVSLPVPALLLQVVFALPILMKCRTFLAVELDCLADFSTVSAKKLVMFLFSIATMF